jgi:O-acetyl-ADP-ribose deacetylase (regulator of RNase III)
MDGLRQSWRLGGLNLRLVEGDLFEVDAASIVNSEQTNFVLSANESTISGQIRRRLGKRVQEELNGQTRGTSSPPGTVLVTGGSPLFSKVYHAGFHEPWVWYDMANDDGQTEHLRSIRQCVRDILQRLKQDSIQSVAFPLLGCGLFGLDPRLLAYEFTKELADFAQDPRADGIEVILVLRNSAVLQGALEGMVQALIDHSSSPVRKAVFRLGVEHLDRFESRNLTTILHPTYAAWMLLRYAELVTGFLFFTLASETVPALRPQDSFGRGCIEFGPVISQALKLAAGVQEGAALSWSSFFRELLQDETRLKRLKKDRNDVAHGRKPRSLDEVEQDLKAFIKIERWQDIGSRTAPPTVALLQPWLRRDTAGDGEVGVLDSWNASELIYLVPHNGMIFRLLNEHAYPL